MAVAIVQEQGNAAGSVTSIAPSLASGATAGNLLIAILGKGNTAAVTHTDWTRLYTVPEESTAERGVVVWKVAAGGETAGPTFSWTGAVGAVAWMAELSGANTTTPLDASSTPEGSGSNVTSRNTNTTGTTTVAGMAFGIWVGAGAFTTRSYTNSFSELEYQQSSSFGRSLAVATLAVSSGVTTNSTCSWTSGAQIVRAGCIVIGEAAGGSAQNITGAGAIASAEAFGSPTVTTGAVTVSPGGIASGEAFGSPTVTPGAVTVSPVGIASGEAFGTPTVTREGDDAQAITDAGGIASAEAFGTPVVTPGAVTVSPVGIAATGALGTPTVTPGAVTVSPVGIAATGGLGTPVVTTGAVTVSPVGIAATTAFGRPHVTVEGDVEPDLVSQRATAHTATRGRAATATRATARTATRGRASA